MTEDDGGAQAGETHSDWEVEVEARGTRTIVIGGGIAGLATAGLLAREGHDVLLLERGDTLGGRAGELVADGFRFDTGPSWYLMPSIYEHYFRMMGTTAKEQLELIPLDPAYELYVEPKSYRHKAEHVTVPKGREKVRALFESRERGAGEELDAYLDSGRRAVEMAERHFLYNPFDRPGPLVEREVLRSLPELSNLLLTDLESFIEERFQDPVLRQILGYPAVFLGTRPSDAPAMYHMMSALDLDEAVTYPKGGFRAVVDALARLAVEAGVEIQLGAEVTRITSRRIADIPSRSRATGVVWRDASGDEHVVGSDIVVSGADLHHTETMLVGPKDRTYNQTYWDKRTSGPGAVLVMLGVKGELPELAHHSLFLARDWHENFGAIFDKPTRVPDPASTYVCKPSATDADVAPDGHEAVFALVPIPADVSIGHGGANGEGDAQVEQIADAAIDMIAKWAKVPDLRDRIVTRHTRGPADFATDYHSWKGGMLGPAHILSQSAMFRAQNASRKIFGLYYAGGTTAPGVGVPMCLISAELVLKRIRGDHSGGPLPEPMR